MYEVGVNEPVLFLCEAEYYKTRTCLHGFLGSNLFVFILTTCQLTCLCY